MISGVPQGSVLGPLLFLILIADIDAEVIHAIIKSFADDTRAMKGINTKEDVATLQWELEKIYKWSDENNMGLNDKKFEGVLVQMRKSNQKPRTPHLLGKLSR